MPTPKGPAAAAALVIDPVADATPAVVAAPEVLRVRATADGFYKSQRVRTGTVFTLLEGAHFTPSWMERVDPALRDELAARTHPRKTSIVPSAPVTTRLQALAAVPSRSLVRPPDDVI